MSEPIGPGMIIKTEPPKLPPLLQEYKDAVDAQLTAVLGEIERLHQRVRNYGDGMSEEIARTWEGLHRDKARIMAMYEPVVRYQVWIMQPSSTFWPIGSDLANHLLERQAAENAKRETPAEDAGE